MFRYLKMDNINLFLNEICLQGPQALDRDGEEEAGHP